MSRDFRFLIVNTKSKWEKQYNKNLEVGNEGIALERNPTHVIEWKINKSKILNNVTDITIDNEGVLYILDVKGRILSNKYSYNSSNNQVKCLKCFGNGNLPEQFNDPCGIVISPNTIYIADIGNNRIQAFTRTNWQLKWIVTSDNIENNSVNYEFKPQKIVINNKFIVVLDNQNQRISILDKGGRLKRNFKPKDIQEIKDITVDRRGYLYVLGKDNIVKLRVNKKGIPVKRGKISIDDVLEHRTFVVDSNKDIYIVSGTSEAEISNIFIYKYYQDGTYKKQLMEYNGTCSKIIVDKNDDLYILNEENTEITFLKFIKDKYHVNNAESIVKFEGKENYQKWHKLVLDAEIPKRTQIDLFYHTDNKDTNWEDIRDWRKLTTFQSSETIFNNNLHEILLKGDLGKYLWVKIDFISSDEYKTPAIKSIKAVFPRISYLRYLPAVYQDDESSKNFLERFLSLFETFIWNTEEEIAHIARYFDAESTPKEFLSWLASWIGTVPDENWSEDKIRKFLVKAGYLYKKRGTREGIEEMIELYTDIKPIIVENTVEDDSTLVEYWQVYRRNRSGKLKLIGNKNQYFKNTVKKPQGNLKPYNFCVLLNPEQKGINIRKSLKIIQFKKIDDNLLGAVKRMIELEKPAHTTAEVSVMQQRIVLDLHTYIGINSYLSESMMPIRLGITSFVGGKPLQDQEDAGMIEKRSKLGIDTKLD